MTFHLVAIKPASKKYKDFERNNWGWRPLWWIVKRVCCKTLTIYQGEAGTFNDGILIRSGQSKRIAKSLFELLEEVNLNEFIDDAKKTFGNDYHIEINDIKDFANFAKNSGGFRIL